VRRSTTAHIFPYRNTPLSQYTIRWLMFIEAISMTRVFSKTKIYFQEFRYRHYLVVYFR